MTMKVLASASILIRVCKSKEILSMTKKKVKNLPQEAIIIKMNP
jgi:hypothetical protein